MLRILPPATFNLANLAKFRSWVGVFLGKTRRQISCLCLASGKGYLTIKRIRRRKALSIESFRLVVRIAKPWYSSMRCNK